MNTTILVGENWHGLKKKLDELVNDFVAEYGDMALEKLDASDADIQEIIQGLSTPAFLSPKKLYVLYNLSANKQAAEGIEQILNLDGPVSYTHLTLPTIY